MPLITEYNPAWPAWFEHIRTVIADKLGSAFLTIEHFGSTSVPGMVAKPIIDLDVVIEPEEFETVKALLGELGYHHEGDLGIPEREAFRLHGSGPATALPDHHLYVCPRRSAELRRHRAFRAFLQAHPDWAERLSDLKRSLAAQHGDDRDAYIDGKDALVREITALAMEDAAPADEP